MTDRKFNQKCYGQFDDAYLIEDGWIEVCDWCQGQGLVGVGDPSTGDTIECYGCGGRGHKLLDENDIEDLSVRMLERIEELTQDKN